MIWPFKSRAIPIKTMLVEGFEPWGDDFVFQRFWLLTEYKSGHRRVEKMNGAILSIKDDMDMSIAARVRAWELNGKIAPKLFIDLTKLDRTIEKAVMQ